MQRIGFLIPEFPGQTHAFFIRERNELKKLGIETKLLSTRMPPEDTGFARHDWAAEAQAETAYLAPMSPSIIALSLVVFIGSGPVGWWRCLARVFGHSDVGVVGRLKLLGFMLAGAHLKHICRKEQLLHVHVHSFANATNVAMFAKLMGGPSYSATLHGPVHDYGNNQRAKWSNAAFAIVITEELVAEIKGLVSADDLPPIYLAPMGVNIDDFVRSSEYQPPAVGEELRLVSCGRLNYVKAHDDLIRVVALLREKDIDATLSICGARDILSENYFEELQTLVAELGLKEKVNFLGSVPESQVKAELENAHFFCLASLKEPLGVATMEAMAMQVPAIVTRSPGVEEMIEQNVDGVMVEPRNPESFVTAICQLLQQPQQAQAIAQAGRKTVEQRFHSGVSASKIAEGFKLHAKH